MFGNKPKFWISQNGSCLGCLLTRFCKFVEENLVESQGNDPAYVPGRESVGLCRVEQKLYWDYIGLCRGYTDVTPIWRTKL